MKKLFTNEDGQVLVLFALVLVVLMGFAALAVDVGSMTLTKTKLQSAADAAALAGAQDLPVESTAEDTAVEYAKKNGVLESDIIATAGHDGDPNKIKVVCKKKVSHTFARIIGFKETEISARAVAQGSNSQWTGEALPFVNLEDNYAINDELEVWEKTENGKKERIHDDVITVPNDHTIRLTIRTESNGDPYIYMKGGTDVGSIIPTPLTNIVTPNNTVYVLSLRSDLIANNYSTNVIGNNINKYHLPLSDLVLLKCKVTAQWSNDNAGRTCKLLFEECYSYDEMIKGFKLDEGGARLIE